MKIISRSNESTGWRRTSGIYGHWPLLTRKVHAYSPDGTCEWVTLRWPMLSSVGYLRIVTEKRLYTFWYMGNPYRHKIFENYPNYANRV